MSVKPLTRSPIRVVLGSPGALEDALLAAAADSRRADPLAPLDVLVGGVLLRPYLQRRIADTSAGMVNVRFTTLGELGLRLGEQALVAAGRRALPAITERGYAAEIARASEGYFAPVATTAGFGEATRRLVRELRQEGIELDRFAELVDSAAESPEKAQALTDLFARYTAGRAGYYDGEDAIAAADPLGFDGTALLLYGVQRLGANARALVEGLARRVPVTVFLPTLGPDADQAVEDLRAWLQTLAAVETQLAQPASTTRLTHLQQSLFASSTGAPTDHTARLVSAPGPLAEVKEAARTCLDWARDGVPFREMAIAYRQAEVYRPLVESVFAESGIPVYLDDGPSVAERPLGRRILSLLDLVDTALHRREVMGFLSDGWMPTATRELYGKTPVSRWESVWRRAGVVEGLEQWRFRVGALRAEEQRSFEANPSLDWLDRRVADCDTLLRFIEDFATALRAHPEQGTWSECLVALRPLLRTYVQDVDDVLGYLDQLEQLDELLEPVSYERFLEVVRSELQALKAGDLDAARQGALGRRGVSVLDVNQLRYLRFRAVVVLGLTERVFPPPPRQDPLLLDTERERLRELAATLPLRARGPDPEPLQFALAVHAARERLLLSTRRADEAGGRAKLPSSFFRLAASALVGRRLTIDELSALPPDVVDRLGSGRIGPHVPARALTLAEHDIAVLEREPHLGRAVLHRLAPAAARADALRRGRWGSHVLTEFDGQVAGDEARAGLERWLQESRPFSPSALESYGACPFRFFLENVLRVKPLDEPEAIVELDALTRGSVIHTVLERFLSGIAERALFNDPVEQLRVELLAIAEAELDAVAARGLSGAPLLWRRARQEILDDLVRWLDLERERPTPFTKNAFEVAFGGRWSGKDESEFSRDEPLELVVGGRSVTFRGRIDRIDWNEDGAFQVVDYKTGRNRSKGILNGGRALQLAIYLHAAADLLGLDPARGRSVYEYLTRRGNFSSHPIEGSELVATETSLDGVLGRIVLGALEGDFHHQPDACRFCDFDPVCDAGRVRIAERKAEDARRVSFAEMREVL